MAAMYFTAIHQRMLYATVYYKQKRLKIKYLRDETALFQVNNVSFDMQENKAEAAKLIKSYKDKWGETWTHFSLWKGWPFDKSVMVTPIVPIPTRT